MNFFYNETLMEIYGGYSRRKMASASQIENVKQGGQKADQIQQISSSHHQKIEIPEAEKFLAQSLSQLPQKKQIIPSKKLEIRESESFFSRLWNHITTFFHSLFFRPQ